MTDWIKGRELLEPPYNLNRRGVFNAVKEGILVPYESPDGEQTNRAWRFFPNDEFLEKYKHLCYLQHKLETVKYWSLKSDKEIIEGHKYDLNLNWVGECPLPDLETYINCVLPNQRQKESLILQELPLQIERLEEELASKRVWKDLNLGPAQQEALMERLLDVWYPLDQAEAISGPESEKQSLSATKPQEAKSYAAKVKEETRTKAKTLWEKNQTITIGEMAYRDDLNKVAIMKNGSVYSEVTIKKWIKDLCPNRKPGRRPKR